MLLSQLPSRSNMRDKMPSASCGFSFKCSMSLFISTKESLGLLRDQNSCSKLQIPAIKEKRRGKRFLRLRYRSERIRNHLTNAITCSTAIRFLEIFLFCFRFCFDKGQFLLDFFVKTEFFQLYKLLISASCC